MGRPKREPTIMDKVMARHATGRPIAYPDASCLRCGAVGMAIVPNPDLGAECGKQHWALCSNMCKGPWAACRCTNEASWRKYPGGHISWCEVAHPGHRAKWEADRRGEAGQLLKIATMLAMREEMLPDWLMSWLFPPAEPTTGKRTKKKRAA